MKFDLIVTKTEKGRHLRSWGDNGGALGVGSDENSAREGWIASGGGELERRTEKRWREALGWGFIGRLCAEKRKESGRDWSPAMCG